MTRHLFYVLKIVFLSIICNFITEFNCRDIVESLSDLCRVGILSAEEAKKHEQAVGTVTHTLVNTYKQS